MPENSVVNATRGIAIVKRQSGESLSNKFIKPDSTIQNMPIPHIKKEIPCLGTP